MKRGQLFYTANVITGLRFVFSAGVLAAPLFSPVFYTTYLAAGLSDMVDGTVARKTGTAGEFGAKLDTAADTVLAAACLIKLIPALDIPLWLVVWTGVIGLIKAVNIIAGYVMHNKFVAVHSALNKATGVALFLLPLTLSVIDLTCSGACACALATLAALHEGLLVRRGTDKN
ncbi:MAG: CDP-alcohol phosphatidyltransferase family protein [Abditibacteriota bacterium]|nr:CDP-alcohol phosphatidyltransferase family protein [Abditibacteriota bacterium]